MAMIKLLKTLEFFGGMAGMFMLAYFVALLGGCAAIGNLPAPNVHPGDPAMTLTGFVKIDAQTALNMATQAGDKPWQNCFQAVVNELPTNSPSLIQPIGALSLFEAGRVARLQLTTGLSDATVSACGPAVLNSQKALLNAVLFLRP